MLVLALALLAGCKKNAKKTASESTDSPPPNPGSPFNPGGVRVDPNSRTGGGDIPEGWAEARDTVAGFRLLMPGRTLFYPNYKGAGPEMQKMQATSTSHGMKGLPTDVKVRTLSYVPPAGFQLVANPEQLFAGFQIAHPKFETFYEILEKPMVQLGGKPALKLVVRGVDLIKGAKLPDDPEMRRERLERMKQREEQRSVYFVVAHGARIFYLLIEFPGPIDDAFLKRVTDSFQYL
jgi:hypothetical protein